MIVASICPKAGPGPNSTAKQAFGKGYGGIEILTNHRTDIAGCSGCLLAKGPGGLAGIFDKLRASMFRASSCRADEGCGIFDNAVKAAQNTAHDIGVTDCLKACLLCVVRFALLTFLHSGPVPIGNWHTDPT